MDEYDVQINPFSEIKFEEIEEDFDDSSDTPIRLQIKNSAEVNDLITYAWKEILK
ncbi:MAG: hypothetical protein R2852_02115 [Bacteroidia bacterium]